MWGAEGAHVTSPQCNPGCQVSYGHPWWTRLHTCCHNTLLGESARPWESTREDSGSWHLVSCRTGVHLFPGLILLVSSCGNESQSPAHLLPQAQLPCSRTCCSDMEVNSTGTLQSVCPTSLEPRERGWTVSKAQPYLPHLGWTGWLQQGGSKPCVPRAGPGKCSAPPGLCPHLTGEKELVFPKQPSTCLELLTVLCQSSQSPSGTLLT